MLRATPIISATAHGSERPGKLLKRKGLRFIMPFMVKVWIVGSIALAVAVWIGYT